MKDQNQTPAHDGMKEDVCEHCAFSNFGPTGPTGECRANPPTPLLVIQKNPISGEMVQGIQCVFPPIERRTFCHTFEPRTDIIGND